MNLFLTGTDTNIGKTYVASRLVRALRMAGTPAIGLKPICCGERTDAEHLHAASDGAIPLNDVNPVWLRTPAAPYTAAMIENRPIDLQLIRETFTRLRAAHPSIIVEGVGGWRVPIERDYFVSDLAAEMRLPVAIVIGDRLGALNHTLLTIDAIRTAGLECAGLILNQPTLPSGDDGIALATNRGILEDLTDVPILFDLAHGQSEITLGPAA